MSNFSRFCLFAVVAGFLLIWILPIVLIPLFDRYLVIDSTMHRADALVLMAGSRTERLPTAVRLFREGGGKKILLANDGIRGAWSQQHQRNLSEVEWAEFNLLKEKIPAEAIVKLPFSASGTIYDAMHAIEFAREKKIHSLLVVTSDYHSRRTLWCFQLIANGNPHIIGIYSSIPKNNPDISFKRLSILLREFVKNIYYAWEYDSEWVDNNFSKKISHNVEQ